MKTRANKEKLDLAACLEEKTSIENIFLYRLPYLLFSTDIMPGMLEMFPKFLFREIMTVLLQKPNMQFDFATPRQKFVSYK